MMLVVVRPGIGKIFLPIMGLQRRCVDGLTLFKQIVVILVPQLRPAMPCNGCDRRIQNNGNQTAGETVVIQIQTRYLSAQKNNFSADNQE